MYPKYMMATVAIHLTGDITRIPADICVIRDEDENNYVGEWLTGFGFVNVLFPKNTTRELSKKEINKYHGKCYSMSGMVFVLNLTGENYDKKVTVEKENEGIVFQGTLKSPIKKGKSLHFENSSGRNYTTSTVKNINKNIIKTRNSTYILHFHD